MNPEDITNSVWQSHPDEALRSMTPPRFYETLDGVPDDVAEEAWEIFRDRQLAVFG